LKSGISIWVTSASAEFSSSLCSCVLCRFAWRTFFDTVVIECFIDNHFFSLRSEQDRVGAYTFPEGF
jgi:hypothetical protein